MSQSRTSKSPNIKNKPKAVIVIPTLGDRLDLLKKTLESLAVQGSDVLDIIVVCPRKSTDARRLAQRFGAELVDDPKPGGISAAVNAGFEHIKPHHKYGLWMGDDDLLLPGAIKATISALDSNPNAVLAFGYCDYIDDKGRVLFTNKAGKLAPWIMAWGPDLVPLPGLLFRNSIVKKLGGFDPSLKYAMDLDMWLQLRRYGKFILIKQSLGAFRWHPTSTTVANRKSSLTEAEKVKRRYLSKSMKAIAFIWEKPVRAATYLAAKRTNKLASK